MPRFQACIGPSGKRVHIRDKETNSSLSLCETTAPARDVKGAVGVECFCRPCLLELNKHRAAIGAETITAEMIGVAEIV